MAELMDLRYHPGRTFLHSLDARIKVAGTAAWSMAGLNAGPEAMILVCILVAIAAYPLRRTLLGFFLRLKFFLLLLIGIWLARALTTSGEPLVNGPFFTLTLTGMWAGLMVCWRLTFIVVISLMVTATTPADLIRAAIEWWLRRIPFLPSQAISDMIGLMIRFMPMIFICSQRISEAQRSRGMACRRRPLYRLRVFSMALLRQCFQTADQLGGAMAARCYNPRRPVAAWPMQTRDWFVLGGVVLLGLALLVG